MQKKSTYSIKKQKLQSQTNNDLRVYMMPVEAIRQAFFNYQAGKDYLKKV